MAFIRVNYFDNISNQKEKYGCLYFLSYQAKNLFFELAEKYGIQTKFKVGARNYENGLGIRFQNIRKLRKHKEIKKTRKK